MAKAKVKAKTRKKAADPKKAVSVMAWIEDAYGNLLLVKQSRGKKLWSLPGGKVRSRETLMGALRREIREELALSIDVAALIDLYDRPAKGAVAILYRAILRPQQVIRPRRGEILKYAFRRKPPGNATPSLKYFWTRAQVTFEPLSLFGRG